MERSISHAPRQRMRMRTPVIRLTGAPTASYFSHRTVSGESRPDSRLLAVPRLTCDGDPDMSRKMKRSHSLPSCSSATAASSLLQDKFVLNKSPIYPLILSPRHWMPMPTKSLNHLKPNSTAKDTDRKGSAPDVRNCIANGVKTECFKRNHPEDEKSLIGPKDAFKGKSVEVVYGFSDCHPKASKMRKSVCFQDVRDIRELEVEEERKQCQGQAEDPEGIVEDSLEFPLDADPPTFSCDSVDVCPVLSVRSLNKTTLEDSMLT